MEPTWTSLAVIISLLALIGPGLIWLGVFMGKNTSDMKQLKRQASLIWRKMDERDEKAHKRMNRIEEKLTSHLIRNGQQG